nr:fimbria/pilus outer membrane usher protein [Escherichia coli]
MKELNKKYTILCMAWLMLISSNTSFAKNKYEFDTELINSVDKDLSTDVLNFNPFPAGDYVVDIFINGNYRLTHSVVFVKNNNEHNELSPCLDEKLLLALGIKKNLIKTVDTCSNQNNENWLFKSNLYEQSLNITIPEVDLDKTIDGVAPKITWDDGVNAFLLNYKGNLSNINNKKLHDNQNYAYLDLSPGFNFGAWRFRNKTFFNYVNSRESKWQNVNNYFERGIKEFNSRFTLGDFLTKNDLFSSSSLRGVALSTDELMIPRRLKDNSPLIRGIAKTQARVEVEYNGYIIYTKTVDAGVFEINDLPNMGAAGEYKVTVFETDGTKNVILIPFIRSPLSLKKGFSKYAVSFGRYRRNSDKNAGPPIFDAGYSYGLNEFITTSTSVQVSNIYEAYAVGLSLSLGSFGALSLEGSNANAREYDKKKAEKKGEASILKYSKGFNSIDADLYFNNGHNSRGYKSLNDVYSTLDSEAIDSSGRKNSTSIGINKLINNYGRLLFSYNLDHYWDGSRNEYIDVSFDGVLKEIAYSLGYTANSDKYSKNNHVFSLSINIPFKRENERFISAGYKYNNSKSQGEYHTVGFSGAEYNNTLSWNIRQKYSNNNYYGVSGNTTLRYQLGYLGIGASTERDGSSYNADIGGGLVYSEHGLTFGQEITQSSAILVAKGAVGVPVTGTIGVRTNLQGRALVTGLQPYRENILSLDPLETPDDIEILQSDIKVIPTNGAIVEGKFRTSEGQKTLVRITTSDNKNIPFGSIVTLKGSYNNAGIVGDNGEVFLTGLPESGILQIKWGNDNNSSCSVNFKKLSNYNPKALVCD